MWDMLISSLGGAVVSRLNTVNGKPILSWFRITFLGVVILALFSSVAGQEFQDNWGPEIGSEVPEITMTNLDGEEVGFEELLGDGKALLFVFSRSANW